jgi:hypothetical protein
MMSVWFLMVQSFEFKNIPSWRHDMTGRPLAGFLLALLTAGSLFADDPKPSDPKAFDKLVVDTLRDVHNKGADLYNTSKDFAGAYRMYQGALLTVRPFLAHRPVTQKMIDDGLAAAEKETSVAQKAFKLHEAIEIIRTHLKATNEPIKKPEDKKPVDTKKHEDKKPVDTKKPEDTKKPVDVKKPDDTKKPVVNPDTIAPPPREKKNPVGSADPKPKDTEIGTTIPARGPSGKVTLRGQPLTAAEVTLVSLDRAKPRVFTATIKADGSYGFTETLPPGKYVVIVTAKTVPEKYQTTTTSGLTIEVKAGIGNHDIELK